MYVVNKYVFSLFLKTARKGAAFYVDRHSIVQHGCLHVLVMSGQFSVGVDHYTFACAHFSVIGAELGITEPYYEEPCRSTSSITPWSRSSPVCANSDVICDIGN